MNLDIKIADQEYTLILRDGNMPIDSISFIADRSLGEQLIVKLDKIFTRSKINKSGLTKVKIVGDIDKNTTNYKLLQAFKKGLES